jgi:DNA-binding transcriptional regulator YdaS (Cro superfamily)
MNIEQAISTIGLTKLAHECGCTAQHVNNWRTRGIPADRTITFARATGWRTTPHQLRPDIYPNPTDGIPPEVVQSRESQP